MGKLAFVPGSSTEQHRAHNSDLLINKSFYSSLTGAATTNHRQPASDSSSRSEQSPWTRHLSPCLRRLCRWYIDTGPSATSHTNRGITKLFCCPNLRFWEDVDERLCQLSKAFHINNFHFSISINVCDQLSGLLMEGRRLTGRGNGRTNAGSDFE